MKEVILKIKLMLFRIALTSFIMLVFCQCNQNDEPYQPPTEEPVPEENLPQTKGAFDDPFDWDRVDEYAMYNPNLGRVINIDLPWAKGSASSLGIPSEWLDPDAYNPVFSERYYSRENGWNLVYSNLTKNTVQKYFALYNQYTGILRFFFYTLSNASGGGNSNLFWGIRINKPSSLFNFTYEFTDGQDNKASSPSFITTPRGALMGTEFLTTGYQVNNWYGIEVECAYDPSVTPGSLHNFEIRGWAANKTIITGSGETTGSINGTITYAAPNLNFNLNLANMFNNTSSYKNIALDNYGIIEGLGSQIENGVNRNDSFFKDLWNSIKSKAGAGIGDGIKSGLSSILSSGGSIVANALKGTVSSVLGIGGSKPSVGRIDLTLLADTKFTFEAESQLPGWGAISEVPVPGSTSNASDMPLYNTPLGVWNLNTTPTLLIEGIAHDCYTTDRNFYKGIYQLKYFVECSQSNLVINPALINKVTIKNFNIQLVAEEYTPYVVRPTGNEYILSYSQPSPFGLIGNKKYYSRYFYGETSTGKRLTALYGPLFKTNSSCFDALRPILPNEIHHGIFKAVISFNLVENTSGKTYSFSRWFNVKFGKEKFNFRKLYIKSESDFNNYVSTTLYTGYPPTSGYTIISESNTER